MSKPLLALSLLCSLVLANDASSGVPKLDKRQIRAAVQPEPSVFTVSSATKPLVLKSVKAAKKHFKGEYLKALDKQVNWKAEKVLVFAWFGSGSDKLIYSGVVYEKVAGPGGTALFEYTRGKSSERRPYIHVYVIEKGLPFYVAMTEGM